MTSDIFAAVPEHQHELIRSALTATFDSPLTSPLVPVSGGASGASIYRVAVAGKAYLLRIETRRDGLRNPHQYVCMRTAAEAGLAPTLHHVDEATGITIMDFIVQRPLSEYPGGPVTLARDLGALIARLQATPMFPELREYPVVLERLLGYLRSSGMFAAGLLDPHVEAFELLRAAYPWHAAARTSSHNDPNPQNILFDGHRLWLIDWETAHRNEAMIDLAILADNFATTPDLQDALLRGWAGRAPDRWLHARLTLLRPLTRLYYAGLIFAVAARGAVEPQTDLSAPTPAEFRAALAEGRLKMHEPDTLRTLGKMLLAGFLSGSSGSEVENALAVVRAG